PRTLVPRQVRALHFADQQEVLRVALPLRERRTTLEEQRIARSQLDVADFAAQAPAVTRGRDHDRVVARAKAACTDRPADKRTARRDDDLHETALGTRRSQLEELLRGGIEAAQA